MTHRDRVFAAIERQEPDRVPIDLGSVGSLICDETHLQVRELLGLKGDLVPYRSGSTTSYYDEQMLDAFDIDFRHVWLESPDKPKATFHDDGTVTDEWGIVWSSEGSYPCVFPLAGLSAKEISDYKWPIPEKRWDINKIAQHAKYLREETDYAVVAKSVFSGGGILERCCYLRTIDEFFVDMLIDKETAHMIIDKVVDVEIAYWDRFLDGVAPYIDIVQRVSDLGTQDGLFISRALFQEFLKPAEDKVYRYIKSRAPQVKIWFHSCGAIDELIGDFLDIGVEILNPVQPLAKGMDSASLKKKYGDKLCFHGGIDLQQAMIGSINDVKEEVEKRIRAFAPGGGYILAPANHLQNDTPAQNIVFLYEYAKKFGKYPIQ